MRGLLRWCEERCAHHPNLAVLWLTFLFTSDMKIAITISINVQYTAVQAVNWIKNLKFISPTIPPTLSSVIRIDESLMRSIGTSLG